MRAFFSNVYQNLINNNHSNQINHLNDNEIHLESLLIQDGTETIARNILFFLAVNDVLNFSLVNKKFNEYSNHYFEYADEEDFERKYVNELKERISLFIECENGQIDIHGDKYNILNKAEIKINSNELKFYIIKSGHDWKVCGRDIPKGKLSDLLDEYDAGFLDSADKKMS